VLWCDTSVLEDSAASILNVKWKQQGPLKCWCLTTLLGVTTQKTLTWATVCVLLYNALFSTAVK
jgi:hypothetical protein